MKLDPSITDRLKTQHLAIENVLSPIETDRLFVRPEPGKWNIHDNIAHLARYQLVFIDRINKILLNEQPSFGRYIAEEDPEFENWMSMDINNLSRQLKKDRLIIYDMVINLTDQQINKIGIHKKFGSLNVIQWTEFFLLHEAHHIFTIFQLAYDSDLK